MKRILSALILTMMSLAMSPIHAQDETEAARPLLLAHYMPWYQSPDVYGSYGWHWTMQHFNPNVKDENGKREIASQYYPLTGPYNSSDPAVLEYQVALMKLSGIDGVIVDWYGASGFNDYGLIDDSTLLLLEAVKRAGLTFVLCYEDRTVKTMLDAGRLANFDAGIEQGRADMQYAQEHYFSDESYLTRDGKPVLYVFGPLYFRSAQNWDAMFEGLPAAPVLIVEDQNLAFGSASNYPWPPMNFAGGGTLAPAVLDVYLDQFYSNARRKEFVTGSAFPAFHDIYEEAGVRSSYGFIDPLDGETFRRTIARALEANAEIIQLVTWNDYGEGTIIEPTEEFGYDRLGIVQETRKSLDAGFAATPDDLLLPMRLLTLRRANEGDEAVNGQLDMAFAAIIAGDVAGADAILTELEGVAEG